MPADVDRMLLETIKARDADMRSRLRVWSETNSGTANIQGERGDPVVIELSYDFEFVTPMGAIMEFLVTRDAPWLYWHQVLTTGVVPNTALAAMPPSRTMKRG